MKYAIIFYMFLVSITYATVNPAVKIDFTVTDDGDIPSELHTQPCSIGLDAAATNGIDTLFGESLAPPFAPSGMEARMVLTTNGTSFPSNNNNTWKDYRPAIYPFTGTVQYRIYFQASTDAENYTLHFDNFTLPLGGSFSVQVIDLFGGAIVNHTLSSSGTVQVPTSLSVVKLNVSFNSALPVEIYSSSLAQYNNSIVVDWVTATEVNNYGFDIERKLLSEDSTKWTKVGFVQGYGNSNSYKDYEFIDVNPPVSDLVYRLKQIDLNGDYIYYVINRQVSYTSFTLPSVKIDFSVTDNGTVYNGLRKRHLSIGFDPSASDGIDISFGESLAPPFAPDAMDARLILPPFSSTENNTWYDFRSGSLPYTGQQEFRLFYQPSLNATSYTLHFDRFCFASATGKISIQVIDLFGGVVVNDTVSTIDSIVINNVNVQQLKLVVNYENVTTGIEKDDHLNSFMLHQNYPNPFNPTTTVEFELDKASAVKIELFDILGNKVRTISEGFCKEGINRVKINGNYLSSGTYFCKVSNAKASKIIKMILLK